MLAWLTEKLKEIFAWHGDSWSTCLPRSGYFHEVGTPHTQTGGSYVLVLVLLSHGWALARVQHGERVG